MKTITLVLLSMVILSGCDMSMGPGAFWKDGENGNIKSRWFVYHAIFEVKTESGFPCTSSMLSTPDFPVDFYADTTGIIFAYECLRENKSQILVNCIIYKYHNNTNIFWEGEIPFTPESAGVPEPFEVVFPD